MVFWLGYCVCVLFVLDAVWIYCFVECGLGIFVCLSTDVCLFGLLLLMIALCVVLFVDATLFVLGFLGG